MTMKTTMTSVGVTPKDIEGFKQDIAMTVTIMMRGRKLDEDEYCARGLETKSRAGSIQLKSRRRYSQSVILQAQEKQRNEGRMDHDEIARIYQEATRSSIVSAIARGQSDAQSIKL